MTAVLQSLNAAVESLRSNPLRTVLSTLGVIIGVASLVAILALGDGLERYSRAQIAESTDLQTVVVTPKTTDREDGILVRRQRVERLDREAVAGLQTRLGERADAMLFVMGAARMEAARDTEQHAVLLTATEPAAALQLREGVVAGRFLTAADVSGDSAVAVVPLEALGADARAGGVGESVRIGGDVLRVIGVTQETGPILRVYVPLSDARREQLEGPDRPTSLAVRARRVEDVERVRAATESWLAERYGAADGFAVASNQARAAQARQGMLVFKLVMGAIAGISLLVGGIGIMNILLASVLERTREIGIRKASGARQRDILVQFLAEAVTITGVGSVLGVVVGLAGAFGITAAIRHYTDAPLFAAFTWGSVLVAAGAALVVGLAFGTYPARRAAKLSPIEAIRHE